MQREQAALQALGQVEELYPEHPEQDPSGLYAALPVSPILERGLTYLCLAEHSPGHKYEHAAWATFEQIERPSVSPPVPERVRFEIVNHQARTAVLMNDLDACEVYLDRGFDGAARLRSRPRYHEACAVWRRAKGVWPDEPRVKVLHDRLRSPVGSWPGNPS